MKNKIFWRLVKRLDENIEKDLNLFFKDRPFLESSGKEPVINEDHTDEETMERIENEFEREEIIKKLCEEE